jgi:hypothetical protein
MTSRSFHFLCSSLLSGRGWCFRPPLSYRNWVQFPPKSRPAIPSQRLLHSGLWPPFFFANLLVVVLAYKVWDKQMRLIIVQCLTLIIFQNKLIYLPYIPFGAPQVLGVDWTVTKVKTRDGTKLSTCVAQIRLVHVHASNSTNSF